MSLSTNAMTAGEIGAVIGISSNGTYFLEKQWNIDMSKAKPIVLKKLIRHDWKTGKVQGEMSVGDYKAKFGTHYYGVSGLTFILPFWKRLRKKDRDGHSCKLVTQ